MSSDVKCMLHCLIVEPFLAKKRLTADRNCDFMDSSDSNSCSKVWDARKRHVTQIRSKFRHDCADLRRQARIDRMHIIKRFERAEQKSAEQRRKELWRSGAGLGIIRRIDNEPLPSLSMEISELEENVETQIQSRREHMHDEIESFMQPGLIMGFTFFVLSALSVSFDMSLYYTFISTTFILYNFSIYC